MNKLTEIKEAKEEYEAKGFMPHIESVGEIERVSCDFHNKAYDRISYLISLLEEKDSIIKKNDEEIESMLHAFQVLQMENSKLEKSLEEKDKVLEVLADKSNWFKVTDRIDQNSGYKLPEPWAWKDQREPWNIARKALNTSSNREGE